MALANAKGVTITLPVDFVISNKFGEDGEITTATAASGIPAGFMGLDCGPESIKLNNEVILGSQTIIWNGPMGVFEMAKFETGTKSMMDTIVSLAPPFSSPLANLLLICWLVQRIKLVARRRLLRPPSCLHACKRRETRVARGRLTRFCARRCRPHRRAS
jgi:hypothetical protein